MILPLRCQTGTGFVRLLRGSILLAAVCAGLAGCAGSASTPVMDAAPAPSFSAATAPIGPVSAQAAPGVIMAPSDLQRITQLVQSDLYTAYPTRLVPAGAAAPGEVKIDMTFLTYDKGNAFARLMLAGLGQIHIVANVQLTDASSGKVKAEYAINKTFAWGGFYGGSTSIEDVETGFAASVVAIFKKTG
jgi:hypothetical protein